MPSVQPVLPQPAGRDGQGQGVATVGCWCPAGSARSGFRSSSLSAASVSPLASSSSARDSRSGALGAGDGVAAGTVDAASAVPALRLPDRAQAGRGEAAVDLGQMVPDHLQRHVVLALHGQDVAQPLDVGVGVAPIARGARCGAIRPSDSRNRILEMETSGKSAAAQPAPDRCCGLRRATGGQVVGHAQHRQAPTRPRAGWRRTPAGTCRSAPRRRAAAAAPRPGPVDVGAVQAAQVLDHDALVGPGEGGVPARHRDVVEEDVGVLVPAGRDLSRCSAGTARRRSRPAARSAAPSRRAAH